MKKELEDDLVRENSEEEDRENLENPAGHAAFERLRRALPNGIEHFHGSEKLELYIQGELDEAEMSEAEMSGEEAKEVDVYVDYQVSAYESWTRLLEDLRRDVLEWYSALENNAGGELKVRRMIYFEDDLRDAGALEVNIGYDHARQTLMSFEGRRVCYQKNYGIHKLYEGKDPISPLKPLGEVEELGYLRGMKITTLEEAKEFSCMISKASADRRYFRDQDVFLEPIFAVGDMENGDGYQN